MANNQSSIKFDHREIAVIFSLFIFVSLLMFTVGILVGKGLAQARYDGGHGTKLSMHEDVASGDHEAAAPAHGDNHASLGTSITTGHDEHAEEGHGEKADEHHATPGVEGEHDSHASSSPIEGADEHNPAASHAEHAEANSHEPKSDLELVPKHPKNKMEALNDFPKTKDTDSLLHNPKMAGIFEGSSGSAVASATKGGTANSRATASLPSTPPKSFAKGKYTVQIGSYPNQREALERVESLKKLGFPYAYFSAKDLGDKNTWYRVWLGYFPDKNSAEVSGEILQSRGEVNSYLVRKADSNG